MQMCMINNSGTMSRRINKLYNMTLRFLDKQLDICTVCCASSLCGLILEGLLLGIVIVEVGGQWASFDFVRQSFFFFIVFYKSTLHSNLILYSFFLYFTSSRIIIDNQYLLNNYISNTNLCSITRTSACIRLQKYRIAQSSQHARTSFRGYRSSFTRFPCHCITVSVFYPCQGSSPVTTTIVYVCCYIFIILLCNQ